jgi:hypothetical protein
MLTWTLVSLCNVESDKKNVGRENLIKEAILIAAGCIFVEMPAHGGGISSWHGCIDHRFELKK